ncbi:MAG: transcription antitermination factor NusB [Solobacterium sp.]|nr:transcription antitermination factor NusB [Solobacterium sp.]MDY5654277.1 transcription antitermination factor NusB [Erysipelotrichaceae bacterium]MDD6497702.1 transcription antitermination factor NusB [Solobacterium sp.]MDD6834593.1 transcription antitermination factor NusB [Solobacterium sp.]MDD6885512.1 transcription antitermination factor NusB [Solobacterium sp.]
MQRLIALNILRKTISDESFTSLLMRKELEKLEKVQRPFVTNIVQGVLKNYELLEYNVNLYVRKTSLTNKLILMMALYERYFLKEKEYAVNNSYVELSKTKYDKSFINATLRNIRELKYSDNEWINVSLPEWLYKLIKKQYPDDYRTIIENYHSVHKTYYRLNPNKTDFDYLKDKYDIEIMENNVFISKQNLINTDDFNNGFFYIQDINAAKLTSVLKLKEDYTLLDVCSAPGSKLFNTLELLKDSNTFSNDLNSTRLELIKKKALILGYKNINFLNCDGRYLNSKLNMKFDVIMMDVPCSGLGVIGRKPDIKFHIKPENLDELQNIGYEILNNCSKLLKEDGQILYSTCTINRKENEKQIEKFIKNNPEFKIIEEKTIIESYGDLFYYCLLSRV